MNYFRVVPADDLARRRRGRVGPRHGPEEGLCAGRQNGSTAKGWPIFSKSRPQRLGIKVAGRDSIDANIAGISLENHRRHVAGARSGLFRRHDANQRGPTLQRIVRGRLHRQDDGARRLHGGGVHSRRRARKMRTTAKCFSPSVACCRRIRLASGKEFVDKYEAKFGHMPEAYAIYAYEAAKWRSTRSAKPARKIARPSWKPARRSKITRAHWARGRSTKMATRRSRN